MVYSRRRRTYGKRRFRRRFVRRWRRPTRASRAPTRRRRFRRRRYRGPYSGSKAALPGGGFRTGFTRSSRLVGSMAVGPTYGQRKRAVVRALQPRTTFGRYVKSAARWARPLSRAISMRYPRRARQINALGDMIASAAGNMELKSSMRVEFATGAFYPFMSTLNTASQDNCYNMLPHRIPINFLGESTSPYDPDFPTTRVGKSVRFTRLQAKFRAKFDLNSTAVFDDWYVGVVCLRHNPAMLNWTDNEPGQDLSPMPSGGAWFDGVQALRKRSMLVFPDQAQSYLRCLMHPHHRSWVKPGKDDANTFYTARGAINAPTSPWQVVKWKKVRCYNPRFVGKHVGDADTAFPNLSNSLDFTTQRSRYTYIDMSMPLNVTTKFYGDQQDELYDNALYFVFMRDTSHIYPTNQTSASTDSPIMAPSVDQITSDTGADPRWCGLNLPDVNQGTGNLQSGLLKPVVWEGTWRTDFVDN